MSNVPLLIESRLCFQSRKVRGIMMVWGIPHDLQEVALALPSQLRKVAPFSIYQSTPIVCHENRTIEDFRAILMYLDCTFRKSQITHADPMMFDRLLDVLDQLDREVFPTIILPAVRLWANSSGWGSFYKKRALKFHFGADAVTQNNEAVYSAFNASLNYLSRIFSECTLSDPMTHIVQTCIASVLYAVHSIERCWSNVNQYPQLVQLIENFLEEVKKSYPLSG